MWKTVERLRCDKCGTPLIIGLGYRWNKNGTMGMRLSKDVKLVILDADIYERIFLYMEEALGLPIRHIVFEAVSNISRSVFEDMYKSIPGSMYFKRTWIGYHMTARLFYAMSSLVGYSRAEKVRLIPRSYSISVVENPYNIDLMSASIVGAHEFLDGIPYKHMLEAVGDNVYTVTAVVSGGKPDVSQRLEMEVVDTSEAPATLEKCRRCGVPRIVAERLAWNMVDGDITDRRTGVRVAFFAPGVVVSMFREMIKELGEEIPGIAVRCMRDWTLDNMGHFKSSHGDMTGEQDDFETVLRRYLLEFPSFGRGNPVSMEFGESKTRVVIENPYQEYLIAGTIQGLYEGLSKKACKVLPEKLKEGTFAFNIEY
ncbi:MAG: hypothetical protein JXA49_08425 [Actinobacteria bacterium]|nr:hypothetical protein [Actinomycetota bacterium]